MGNVVPLHLHTTDSFGYFFISRCLKKVSNQNLPGSVLKSAKILTLMKIGCVKMVKKLILVVGRIYEGQIVLPVEEVPSIFFSSFLLALPSCRLQYELRL